MSAPAPSTSSHPLIDLAVLRAINNLTVVVPADNPELHQAGG